MRPGFVGSRNRTVQIILMACGLCQIAVCQTSSPLRPADRQLPSYEVATIKPAKDGQGPTLEAYILAAFGMQPWTTQQLTGPEWIDKKTYEIRGKVPESLQDAMSKMTRDERNAQTQLMMQSLLVDRFRLKYHFETREMQVYKLVLAKDGLKMKEISDLTKAAGVRMGGTGQVREFKGAATIPDLAGLLTNVQELQGKPIINETGLSGTFYDFSLRWTSSVAADPANNAAVASDADASSIFAAVQEQLGLKLVAAKAPVKVVIIDHIEPPSPN